MSSPQIYGKRKKWNATDMKSAVAAVREKKMGYLKAAKLFKVPRTTLFRLVGETDTPTEKLVSKKIGRKPVFDENFESMLVDYALEMESQFYGLTQQDLRKLAYQLAVKNNLCNPFNHEAAGRYWLKGFLRRNKNKLSLRKPTGTSFSRAHGFTKQSMNHFYDLLENVCQEKKFAADRIFNVDETGLSIVQSKHPKIIARRGKKQIAAMTSAERGSLITVVACMSPAGIFVPPMMIFPRKNMTETLMRGAPLGSIGRAHPSGWIQTYLFTRWFQHFIEFTKPSEKSPVLLIMDGHYSHTKNIELIDLARKNCVTLLSLPPHCTHKVQPLDRAFMSPLKTYYSEEVRVWLRENNRPLTQYDITELFGRAYRKCQTGEIAAKGFNVGGIFPFNRHIFTDADYLAAKSEDREPESEGDVSLNTSASEPGPSTSFGTNKQPSNSLIQNELEGSSPKIITPSDIAPPIKNKRKLTNRGRKASKSAIITSSPYKQELEEAEKQKVEKVRLNLNKAEKLGLNKKKNIKEQNKKEKCKRPTKEDTDSESGASYSSASSGDVELFKESTVPTEHDVECFFCNGKFSEDVRGEDWIMCVMCEQWVHSECAGYESGSYICDYCK